MTFEAVVKKGHMGSGKNFESKIYIHASTLIEAMQIAKSRGGVKKGRSNCSCQGILLIKPLSN
ncbi:MAG TPA: hypothetical protein P5511_02975 [Candidatus Goldiibacteriota bacterium]|nr:hypothetical protein [Candidatus Goldiibacteriota bacterium]